jgi:hypothetical protein
MNDGHLAQEKLQERVNFGKKYLSANDSALSRLG